jgi:hypothetical protein
MGIHVYVEIIRSEMHQSGFTFVTCAMVMRSFEKSINEELLKPNGIEQVEDTSY